MSQIDIKVLVVDDDEDMRATLMDFISKMGVKVRTAADVPEAQKIIRTESAPFDLILCDLKLPGGDGLDIVKAAHARRRETLVTIVTGFASLETAIEAIRLGAYDYITKPFSLDEIGVQIRNMIERVSLSKENARLSIRLQELYEQVHRLQNDKSEQSRFHEQVMAELKETARKLDLLLSSRPNGAPKFQTSGEAPPDKKAISSLFRQLEKLDRLKESNALTLVEMEEKKRDLIENFVEEL